MNFSNVSHSHELQFMNPLLQHGSHAHKVQSFRNRLLQQGPLWGHMSWQQTHFSLGFPRHGPQLLPAASSSTGFPWGHSLLWAAPALAGGLQGLQVGVCFTSDLHRLQGHSLSHQGLLHGLLGNLCSSTWGLSCPSFPDLDCRAVSLICSLLSVFNCSHTETFFPLLKFVTPPLHRLSLGQQHLHLQAIWH